MGSAAKTPPSEKHNNIKKLEKEVNSAVKKFEREMNQLKEKEKNALLNRDAAGEADDYDKAEEHENEMKQYQEKQVTLTEENKSKVEELEQKIIEAKRELECGLECLKRIEQKKEEYESRKRELKIEKKDGFIQEGRSLTEAVKVLNSLMERMDDLESVKEMAAVRVSSFYFSLTRKLALEKMSYSLGWLVQPTASSCLVVSTSRFGVRVRYWCWLG
jgi:DNA repair exonuclease SbcCD ATPase subunit